MEPKRAQDRLLCMDWRIKYIESSTKPWMVYSVFGNKEFLDRKFGTKEGAEQWIKAEMRRRESEGQSALAAERVIDSDPVGEASEESFPASDPPAWTHITTK